MRHSSKKPNSKDKKNDKRLKGVSRGADERVKALQSLRDKGRQKTKDASMENVVPGQLVKGQGVFLGTWQAKDSEGKGLGKIFNVFAAPENLKDAAGQTVLFTFNDAVKGISSLKKWHGHDGADYRDDRDVYKDLQNGQYNGGWFIPTREFLGGVPAAGPLITGANIFSYKDTGALKGTFSSVAQSFNNVDYPNYYWSCTGHHNDRNYLWVAQAVEGHGIWLVRDVQRMSCRPVRLSPV